MAELVIEIVSVELCDSVELKSLSVSPAFTVELARIAVELRYRKWQNSLQITLQPCFHTKKKPKVRKQNAK